MLINNYPYETAGSMQEINEIVSSWKSYLDKIENWQTLIKGVTPKINECGIIYELKNPINRPTESFAIVDMRTIKITEPHYHQHETEIYYILQGCGYGVVGGKEEFVKKGSIVITFPNTIHIAIPKEKFVLAVINSPPFKAENYMAVPTSTVSI